MGETTMNFLRDENQKATVTVEMDFGDGERRKAVFNLDESSHFSIAFRNDKVEVPAAGPWHKYVVGPEQHWVLRFDTPTGSGPTWEPVGPEEPAEEEQNHE